MHCRLFGVKAISVKLIKKKAYWFIKKFCYKLIYKGKIDLSNELLKEYGKHRSGWSYAISTLERYHHDGAVKFDSFIERKFIWGEGGEQPYLTPWIGFIHIPPYVPDWFFTKRKESNEIVFQSDLWKKSLPYCKGLFTLSQYHKNHIHKRLGVPIEALYHPTEIPDIRWSWESFEANKNKKIVQIGWWLRRLHSIFQLPTKTYKKVFLKVQHIDMHLLMKKERHFELNNQFVDYDSAETISFLPNKEYDDLISQNLVFIHLYDSSANNTIIECIARNTPLLVNPLEPVVEYLGPEYPFYFSDLKEAAEKAEDFDIVYKTYRYLLNYPFKKRLMGSYFSKSFRESNIYKKL